MGKGNSLKQISKESLAEFINDHSWTLWTTLSTGYELTLPSSRRSMNRMFERVSSRIPNTQLFWAAEKFDVKDGFHIHSLWSFDEAIWQGDTRSIYKQFVDDWRTTSNTQKAAVYSERYKKDHGAHHYISKYITKQITDWDWFTSNSVHKEYKTKNVQTIKQIGKRASANRKLQEYCKKNNVTIEELKKMYL